MSNKAILSAVESIVEAAYALSDEEDIGSVVDNLLDAAHTIRGNLLMGNIPEPDVIRDTIRLLNDNDIDFAVIGGMAVAVHGQLRSTEDIDLIVSALPPKEKTNNSDYMRRFNFYRGKSTTGKHLTLDHKKGQVEFLPADDNWQKWALKSAKPEMVIRSKVKTITPEALIVSKIKAMTNNEDRRRKDMPDVISVIAKNKTLNTKEIKHHLDKDEVESFNAMVNIATGKTQK